MRLTSLFALVCMLVATSASAQCVGGSCPPRYAYPQPSRVPAVAQSIMVPQYSVQYVPYKLGGMTRQEYWYPGKHVARWWASGGVRYQPYYVPAQQQRR